MKIVSTMKGIDKTRRKSRDVNMEYHDVDERFVVLGDGSIRKFDENSLWMFVAIR